MLNQSRDFLMAMTTTNSKSQPLLLKLTLESDLKTTTTKNQLKKITGKELTHELKLKEANEILMGMKMGHCALQICADENLNESLGVGREAG